MKISAKVNYTCKAVLELAVHYGDKEPLQLPDISKSQKIPQKFLTQLLLRLKNAGIVNSVRGILGGYHLAKPPSEITLADVIQAVDSQMLSDSLVREYSRSESRCESDDVLCGIWRCINEEILRQTQINFETLKEKIQSIEWVYCI